MWTWQDEINSIRNESEKRGNLDDPLPSTSKCNQETLNHDCSKPSTSKEEDTRVRLGVKRKNETYSEQSTYKKHRSESLLQQSGKGQSESPEKKKIIEIQDMKTIGVTRSAKYQRTERKLLVKLKHNIPDFHNIKEVEEQILSDFQGILDKLTLGVLDHDYVTMYVSHHDLDQELFIRPHRKKDLTSRAFLDTIATVSQSNKSFLMDGKLDITLGIVRDKVGGGGNRRTRGVRTQDETLKGKKGVITIPDEGDNSCFWRALAIGIHYDTNKNILSTDQLKIYRRSPKHREAARKLASDCNETYSSPMSLSDIQKVASALDINIIVINAGKKKIRLSPQSNASIDPAKPYICLVFQANENSSIGHFNLITKILGYLSTSSCQVKDFCYTCFSIIQNINVHHCSVTCTGCLQTNSNCNRQERNECEGCKQVCFGEICLEFHKLHRCKKFNYCEYCLTSTSKKGTTHDCLERKCGKCHTKYNPFRTGPHRCYIRPKDKETLQKDDEKIKKIHIAFDIESMFVNEPDGTRRHVAVKLVSSSYCDTCQDELHDTCPHSLCERTPQVFRGDQMTPNSGCVTEFGNWLYSLSKRAEKSNACLKVYAHNFSGYDGQFVLEDLFTRGFNEPETIFTGAKLIYLNVDNVSFIDSLKIFNQPLAKLPECFQIPFKKGYFPYESNIPENRHKIIDYPPKSSFGFERMKPDEQEKFSTWYDQQDKANGYDLEEEMESYCIDDVNVLIESIAAYRKQFKAITGLDPTSRKFTLASIGMETFRANNLSSGILAQTPTSSYAPSKDSVSGEAWLNVMEDEHETEIHREFQIGKYKADGVSLEKKIIYEYQGCYYHGCPCKHSNEAEIISARDGKTVRDVRIYDKKKFEFYQKVLPDYKMIIANECNHEYKIETDVECSRLFKIYRKLKSLGLPKHLELRKALKGGRTNNARFYFESDGTNELKYYDFTSLYPSVLKQEKYPIGHPKRITRNFDLTLKNYFGLVYCSVEAPKRMRFPVLGDTIDNKFIFPLCRTCAEEKYPNSCPHSKKERLMYGVWTTVELKKALELGYKIDEIFEVLHYDTADDELFCGQMNMWMREKQEAEGDEMFETPEEKAQFIRDYYEREGIQLRPEKMVKNPGRRYIAKLMLNSFWGKFAQRPNLPKSKIITSHDELLELFTNPKLEILGERRINDNTLFLTYRHKEDDDATSGVENVVVAAFVTSYARLRLFNVIHTQEEKYPNSVYYFDTDSIVFEARPGDDIPKLGKYLGDLTDELKGKTCIEASFNGAKCYSMKTIDERGNAETILKIKGLTLTSTALASIHHNKMGVLAKQYQDKDSVRETVDVPQSRFQIKSNRIFTKDFTKIYKVTSDKRRILDKQNNTVPFGYID